MEIAMQLILTPEIENALEEQARRQGTTPELLALEALRDKFVNVSARKTGESSWPELPSPDQIVALGSVRGKVGTLSRRKTRFFVLYDQLFHRPVRCYMTEGHEQNLRDIWGKDVVVTGLVYREPASGQPLEVREVVDIQVVEAARAGGYKRARGILKHVPTGPSSESRIRQLRDSE
jgi:hypothetical protein